VRRDALQLTNWALGIGRFHDYGEALREKAEQNLERCRTGHPHRKVCARRFGPAALTAARPEMAVARERLEAAERRA
jgi:hypothetical protein